MTRPFFLKLVRNILPWLFAAGIFAYLLSQYHLSQLIEITHLLNLSLFLPFAFSYFLLIGFLDCWSLRWFFCRLGHVVSSRSMASARLASYPPSVLHYGAGQALFAYFLKSSDNVPFLKSSSLFFLIMIFDLYTTFTFALAGSWVINFPIFNDFPLSPILLLIWILFTTALIFMSRLWRFVSRWIKPQYALALSESSPEVCFQIFLRRLPMHFLINSSFFILCITFGAHLPLLAVLAGTPLIVCVAILPITPGGLGTSQIAILTLFKPFLELPDSYQAIASKEGFLLAMSLVWVVSNYLLKVISGSFFMKRFLFTGSKILKATTGEVL